MLRLTFEDPWRRRRLSAWLLLSSLPYRRPSTCVSALYGRLSRSRSITKPLQPSGDGVNYLKLLDIPQRVRPQEPTTEGPSSRLHRDDCYDQFRVVIWGFAP